MGLAAVDEALDRIRSGQPVLVAGVDTLHAGVTVWPAAPAPGPLVEACVAVHTLTDTSDPGGVLVAAGPAAVAADLLRLAGHPAGAWAEVALTDGPAPAHSVLARLADDLDLALVDRADLVHHRWSTESLVVPVADSALPTRWGGFRCVAYRSQVDGVEHLAVVHGDPAALVGAGGAPTVRIHSECLTGDVFGSRRCDCGEQLDEALDSVVGAGAGVVVYLRGHEGRGIGLADKVAAYALQDRGLDTVDANLELGHEADRRHYGAAAQILRDLGVTSVRLLTNNPAKVAELEALGVAVAERLPLLVAPNPHNRHYLETKRRRLGHLSD